MDYYLVLYNSSDSELSQRHAKSRKELVREFEAMIPVLMDGDKIEVVIRKKKKTAKQESGSVEQLRTILGKKLLPIRQ